MPDKIQQSLAIRCLEKSADELDTARINFEAHKYNAVADRAYHSISHGIKAVLALDGKEYKKHSDAIRFFNKDYISEKQLDVKLIRIIKTASLLHDIGNYGDYQNVSRKQASDIIKQAGVFHERIKTYVKEHAEIQNL